ncbi:unnamed protein product [Protopolystoma xenopodis]|uniref:Uncharacterized protein n=1 Tax=Protopolystoma xenopodis TaxID=117903 RepID=A0A448X5E0_9PLAT|nr:unnamed protein product [Protopolystoma xenopodis]
MSQIVTRTPVDVSRTSSEDETNLLDSVSIQEKYLPLKRLGEGEALTTSQCAFTKSACQMDLADKLIKTEETLPLATPSLGAIKADQLDCESVCPLYGKPDTGTKLTDNGVWSGESTNTTHSRERNSNKVLREVECDQSPHATPEANIMARQVSVAIDIPMDQFNVNANITSSMLESVQKSAHRRRRPNQPKKVRPPKPQDRLVRRTEMLALSGTELPKST